MTGILVKMNGRFKENLFMLLVIVGITLLVYIFPNAIYNIVGQFFKLIW
jgi:hypothetical protein